MDTSKTVSVIDSDYEIKAKEKLLEYYYDTKIDQNLLDFPMIQETL